MLKMTVVAGLDIFKLSPYLVSLSYEFQHLLVVVVMISLSRASVSVLYKELQLC